MQFKVPQDVLRPDKIVAFLTLRQLVIVASGGAIAYSLYIILNKQYFIEIWLPPVAFIAVITLAFAFFKFHDIPFEKLILIFIEYKFRPQKRTWQKMKGDAVLSVLSKPVNVPSAAPVQKKPLSAKERRQLLEEITKMVDTHGIKISKIKNQKSKVKSPT